MRSGGVDEAIVRTGEQFIAVVDQRGRIGQEAEVGYLQGARSLIAHHI
jgi:hypothetical protein